MSLRLDHLVFAAADLEAGRAAMAARLGVEAQGGGAHPGFGTRNALWRLGAAYLEVLAPDPEQPEPEQPEPEQTEPEGPRLFGLDPGRLGPEPQLIAWVAACDDIDARLAAHPELGRARPMARGALRWRLSQTPEGRPVWGGLAPALIEWPAGAHPAAAMADRGLRLRRLILAAPAPEALRARLRALGAAELAETAAGPTGLAAELDGPNGPMRFG